MNSNDELKRVDHSAMMVSQLIVIGLNVLAFVLDIAWLPVFVAGVMLVGVMVGRPGFGFVYRYLLQPTGWVKPDIVMDHTEPHRFAQAVGGLFMLVGSVALFVGMDVLGWGLVWVVAALAALNALGGFCVGCMLYYWLARLKVPGFVKSQPDGRFPGLRPKTRFYDS